MLYINDIIPLKELISAEQYKLQKNTFKIGRKRLFQSILKYSFRQLTYRIWKALKKTTFPDYVILIKSFIKKIE